jgi:hypothetical protein
VHLASLSWTIQGPNTYSGTVDIGDAQSIEWVIGGVQAADGYTITVMAVDTSGEPCQGTSDPFNVQAGLVSTTTLSIVCSPPANQAADVTTGSLIVEASIVVAPGDP